MNWCAAASMATWHFSSAGDALRKAPTSESMTQVMRALIDMQHDKSLLLQYAIVHHLALLDDRARYELAANRGLNECRGKRRPECHGDAAQASRCATISCAFASVPAIDLIGMRL